MRPLSLSLLLSLIPVWISAFPPAPYYTLYGMVRDQVGQTLNGEGATLILLKGGDEVGRTPSISLAKRDPKMGWAGPCRNTQEALHR